MLWLKSALMHLVEVEMDGTSASNHKESEQWAPLSPNLRTMLQTSEDQPKQVRKSTNNLRQPINEFKDDGKNLEIERHVANLNISQLAYERARDPRGGYRPPPTSLSPQ